MSKFHVYIKPFDEDGVLSSYVEVTGDVDLGSMGSLTEKIDNDEYNVGVFKFNDINIALRNEHGLYSDIDNPKTMFRYRRSGSLVKITWEPGFVKPICGIAVAGSGFGAKLSTEIDIFEGILDDSATKLSVTDQKIKFQVLSIDSIFDQNESPYSSLDATDLYSEALYTILNVSGITKYLTVSSLNISVGLDQAFDDISDYENTTCKELLDDILFQSNSVLYILSGVVYIKPRTGAATSSKTFYGQGSNDGIEDIINISDVSAGLKKVFNYWRWPDTTLLSESSESIAVNGLRKKDISFDTITDTSKRNAILASQLGGFKDAKQSFDLTTYINKENLSLYMLDRVKVDYPTKYIASDTSSLIPIYGVSVYGASKYPIGEFSLIISTTQNFKIMGRKINFKKQEIVFKMEEI
jgi:hypothetical protein